MHHTWGKRLVFLLTVSPISIQSAYVYVCMYTNDKDISLNSNSHDVSGASFIKSKPTLTLLYIHTFSISQLVWPYQRAVITQSKGSVMPMSAFSKVNFMWFQSKHFNLCICVWSHISIWTLLQYNVPSNILYIFFTFF